ncbi:hypothetical protein [Salipiger mangrovisoli]|uniref:Uncharacterized protein n=1 Tax=Salipiger mangrovisoli TaxID=2865933 RepID=A0ABR9WZT7_9RHOB|nr:hypothetical protein [Salipiger mangrovisoli]MBE9636810.1 hypothetical protein [Salipiger mangrovisoli]
MLRWSDDDLLSRTLRGRGEDRPIGHEDLEPNHDDVETCLGTYGNADGLPQLPDAICKAPAKKSPAEKSFKQVAGSARRLLTSASEAHPGGHGTSSGTLGREVMDQLPMLGMGCFPAVGGGWTGTDGQPQDLFCAPQGGVFIPRFSGDPVEIGHFDFQGAVGRGAVPAGEPAPLLFFGFGQIQSHATNRIPLDPKRRDRWGIPVPHITCALHEEEHALLRRQEENFVETITGVGGQVKSLGLPHGSREHGRGAYPREPRLARMGSGQLVAEMRQETE